jgi:hypothetical protein
MSHKSNSIDVNSIHYSGNLRRDNGNIPPAKIIDFNASFLRGQSYLLHSEDWQNSLALSMIISGSIKPQSGSITLNSQECDELARSAEFWRVREDTVPNWKSHFKEITIIDQIRQGFRNNENPLKMGINDILSHFNMTKERYKRPMSTLSHEAWIASCVIGVASGRSIFCFPYIDSDIIKVYSRFRGLPNLIIKLGLTVFLPTDVNEISNNLCDHIIRI